MRDRSKQASEAREETVLAIIVLAGVASVLSFSTTSREFLDDPAGSAALIPVLAFLGGGIYAFAGYWIGGLALMMGIRGAKGEVTYKEARHMLAYALVPLAASLVVVWPIRLAVYGSDNFRTGGYDDAGSGYWIFTGLSLAFVAWSAAVLVIGNRARFEWSGVPLDRLSDPHAARPARPRHHRDRRRRAASTGPAAVLAAASLRTGPARVERLNVSRRSRAGWRMILTSIRTMTCSPASRSVTLI